MKSFEKRIEELEKLLHGGRDSGVSIFVEEFEDLSSVVDCFNKENNTSFTEKEVKGWSVIEHTDYKWFLSPNWVFEKWLEKASEEDTDPYGI